MCVNVLVECVYVLVECVYVLVECVYVWVECVYVCVCVCADKCEWMCKNVKSFITFTSFHVHIGVEIRTVTNEGNRGEGSNFKFI